MIQELLNKIPKNNLTAFDSLIDMVVREHLIVLYDAEDNKDALLMDLLDLSIYHTALSIKVDTHAFLRALEASSEKRVVNLLRHNTEQDKAGWVLDDVIRKRLQTQIREFVANLVRSLI